MGNPIEVHVTFDPANEGSLNVDPQYQTITLTDPNETVSWFAPLGSLFPLGSFLFLVFADSSLGPFHVVRSINPLNLSAKGNTGNNREFEYTLYLLCPDGKLAKGGPFKIANRIDTLNPAPWVTVRIIKTLDPRNPYKIEPTPDKIQLHEGDTVLLKVTNLPLGAFLTANSTAKTDKRSLPGPFFLPTFATRNPDSDQELLTAATFCSDFVGEISSLFTLWVNEQKVPSPDPTVDGLGRPPGSGN